MNSDATRTADASTVTGDAVNALGDLLTHSAPTAGAGMAAGVPDAPPGFAIETEVGVGGRGVVYLAGQLGLNRPVALKLVKATDRVDAKALIRFLAEAEAVAAVPHPNVAEVHQYGEHAGRPYMALEYCPGGDLTTNPRGGRLAPADTAGPLAAVADGVAASRPPASSTAT
jgi:serine/threonine protein kinase